ncbi:MAG: sigma-70 family RNA polymerase sigma factor [Cyclobacteriaceae bacterium]
MTDTEILTLLKDEGERSSNLAFKAIYQRVFPMIKKLVLDSGGSEDEALDILQDTSLVFYKNVSADKYKSNSSISTYIYAIARNLWYMHLRKQKKMPRKESVESVEIIEITEDHNKELENIRLVEEFFSKLDEGCQRLLKMYYYQNMSMKQIMDAFGLGSEQSTRTKKFRCMKKLEGLFKAYKIEKGSFNL